MFSRSANQCAAPSPDSFESVSRDGPGAGLSLEQVSSTDDTTETQTLTTSVRMLVAETASADLWITRARPTFLYVMYGMILWALPMGLVAAISPRISHAIVTGMTGYLSALPDELYTLFGTGYLGYATLRQWGKVKGADR